MSIAALEELDRRLQQGGALEDVLREFAWQAHSAALARCAAVHRFDRKMYEAVIQPALPPGTVTDFAEIQEHPAIEKVPRKKGWIRVGATDRDGLLADFWSTGISKIESADDIPPALRELSLAAYEYMKAARVGNQFDRLFVLIAADPEKARKYFQRKFREADKTFDRATCHGLLEVLEERVYLLTESFLDVHRDSRAYLSARGFWSVAQYQTAKYLEREYLTSSVEDFFEPTDTWILQVYAAGGMGKTMFMRWLISRHAVPRPHQYPCALIDFDIADPSRATRWPWLLYLKICDQLDQQLPKRPFQDMMADYRSYVAELDRNGPGRGLASTDERMEDQIRQRMLESFSDAKLKKPVLVVLDTMEEVLLGAGADVEEILQPLIRLHDDLPNLRLVLAGRYALHRRSNALRRLLTDRQRVIRVNRFTIAESDEYLQGREIPRDERRKLIGRLANGNPFKLSIFADLIQLEPDISLSALRGYRDADMAYLLKRVVERITDPQVRWLLRYGAVPRQLSIDFVREVMAPFLPPAMSGDKDRDDPDRGHPSGGMTGSDTFRGDLLKSAHSPIAIDKLWNRLTSYAGGHSWVTMVAESEKVIAFHGDVVNPMRRLLENNPVYLDLHRAALTYYLAKAEEEPARHAWIRDAVYHKFQIDGAEAAGFWQQQMDAAENNMLRMYELSLELLGSEYIDEHGNPLRDSSDRPIVGNDILVQARLKLARAALTLAESGDSAAQDRFLKSARKALGSGNRSVARRLPYWHRNLLGARLDCIEGRIQDGLKKLERLRRREAHSEDAEISPMDRFEYDATRAKLLSISDEPRAEAALQEAIDKGLSLGAFEAVRDLHVYEARTLRARGHLRKSVVSFEKARSLETEAGVAVDPSAVNLLAEAEASMSAGNLDNARKLLRQARKSGARGAADTRHQHTLLMALLAKTARRPAECLEMATKEFAALNRRKSCDIEYVGLAQEISAVASADLMEFSEAFDAWEKAAVSYQKAGSRQAANRCTLMIRELECWKLDKLDSLPVTLLQRMVTADDVPLELRSRADLLIIAQGRHKDDIASAMDRSLSMISRVSEGGNALMRARAGLDLITIWRDDAPAGAVGLVDDASRELARLSDWLPLREALERCPQHDAIRKLDLVQRIEPYPDPNTCEFIEAEAAVHLHRLSGDPGRIAAVVQRAFSMAEDEPFAIYALLNAVDRAAVPIEMPDTWADWMRSLLKTYSEWRIFCSHAVVAQTRRLAIDHGDLAAGRMLSSVMLGLLERPHDDVENAPEGASLVNRLTRTLAGAGKAVARNLVLELYEARADENIRHPERLLRVIDAYLERQPTGKESRAKRERLLESRALMNTLRVSAASLVDNDSDGWEHGMEALEKEIGSHRDRRNLMRSLDVWRNKLQVPAVDLVPPAAAAPQATSSADWSIELSVQDDAVTTQSHCPHTNLQQKYTASNHDVLNQELRRLVSEPDWYHLSEMMVKLSNVDGGARLRSELGNILFPEDRPDEFAGLLEAVDSPAKLSVYAEQPVLHALPWELASTDLFPDGLQRDPRFIAFRQMPVRDRPVDEPPRKRRALVIKQADYAQMGSLRGSASQGLDLEVVYQQANYKVTTINDASSSMIAEYIPIAEPDIVHIEAPLFASTDGEGLYLDLASRDERAEPMSAIHLARLLQTGRLPAIIVDVPSPSGRSESIRQLMLRNLFIAVLSNEAPFPAILGIGPSSDHAHFDILQVFSRGLAEDLPLGDLYRALIDADGFAENHEEEITMAPVLALIDATRLGSPM